MILTAHILSGALIGTKFQNPIWGSLFSLLSHYVLDAFPHWEYKIIKNWKEFQNKKNIIENINLTKVSKIAWVKISIDLLIAFGILFYLFKNFSYSNYIFIYGFLGILPDILTFLYRLFPKNYSLKKIFKIHISLHIPKEKNIKIQKIGFIIEMLIIILNIYLLIHNQVSLF